MRQYQMQAGVTCVISSHRAIGAKRKMPGVWGQSPQTRSKWLQSSAGGPDAPSVSVRACMAPTAIAKTFSLDDATRYPPNAESGDHTCKDFSA